MKYNRVLVWFRNDLRVRDNEVLTKASLSAKEVIPVFCFDPRMFEKTSLGFSKTGSFRAKFLIESVADLRKSLRDLGVDLIILKGKPEEEVLSLALKYQAEAIFYSEEVTSEERNVDKSLEKAAWAQGIATEAFWQSTLCHVDDLPFPVNQTPEVFTQFRKKVEKMSSIRSSFSIPAKLNFPEKDEITSFGDLPDLSIYGLEEPKPDRRRLMEFIGGESSGLVRIQSYFWEKDLLKVYKETRNGLIGADYSSKLSPWLALGCISPRMIFEEVKSYERERKKNESTYWLIFELIWRDYFRIICKKHGDKVFQVGGIKNQMDSWSRDSDQF